MSPLRWMLLAAAGLLAGSCVESYSDLKGLRCPSDLLCPGGLICQNGLCVDEHGSGSTGFGTTGGSSGSGGPCLSCPELFLQGGGSGCNDNSASLFNELRSCACYYENGCETDDYCATNLCGFSPSSSSSNGSTGSGSNGGGGGMSPACESCAAANCQSEFNACAFDPKNTGGTSGSVGTTGISYGTTGGTPSFTSGSTSGGTSSGAQGSLQGQLAFSVQSAIDFQFRYSDGGVDPTQHEVVLTDDDQTDSCADQTGYADGGYPSGEQNVLEVYVFDPSDVSFGESYPSLTSSQVGTWFSDGGLPTTSAYAIVLTVGADTGRTSAVSVGGDVSFTMDNVTGRWDTSFSATMLDLATENDSSLSGSGAPQCGVYYVERPASPLTGTLAFPVATVIEVPLRSPNGVVDPDYLQVWFTDDSFDACTQQIESDGGTLPSVDHLVVASIYDPSGWRAGVAYPSLTEAQAESVLLTGAYPTTAYSEVKYVSGTSEYYSISGAATLSSDSSTGQEDVSFSVEMWSPLNGSSSLSGSGAPPGACTVLRPVPGASCGHGGGGPGSCTYATDCSGDYACVSGCCVNEPGYTCSNGVCFAGSNCPSGWVCSSSCCE